MPIKDQRLPTKLTRPGLVRLQCDAGHSWMNAWLYVFEHPYFAVTGADGKSRSKTSRPATTQSIWHEPADGKGAGVTSTVEVDVKDGAPAKADAVLRLALIYFLQVSVPTGIQSFPIFISPDQIIDSAPFLVYVSRKLFGRPSGRRR